MDVPSASTIDATKAARRSVKPRLEVVDPWFIPVLLQRAASVVDPAVEIVGYRERAGLVGTRLPRDRDRHAYFICVVGAVGVLQERGPHSAREKRAGPAGAGKRRVGRRIGIVAIEATIGLEWWARAAST